MHKLLSCILAILLFKSNSLIAQPALPAYLDVVKHFFTLYGHESDPSQQLGFAKKKDGWHVVLINRYQQDSVTEDQLFYAASTKSYLKLQGFGEPAAGYIYYQVQQFIDGGGTDYMPYGFDRCRYYGYNGWDADMIADFGKTTGLSDTLLEGLARAYSVYASRYLWYQYGGSTLSNDVLQQPLKSLELPSEQRVKMVKTYLDTAINLYNQLYQQNPAYATTVGNIGLKCFNESYHAVMQLRLCNRENDAQAALKRCHLLKDDSIAARNYLNGVAQDAIIFTFGDNDTYPLLYLQERYLIRPDVSIINVNLLGLPAYLQYLNRSQYAQFSSTKTDYGSHYFTVAYHSDNQRNRPAQSLDSFMVSYKLGPRLATETDSIAYFSSRSLYLTIDPGKIQYPLPVIFSTDTLFIATGDYVTMDQFMLLDIIRENIYKRPVFFSSNMTPYFENYLIRQGQLFQLAPGKKVSGAYKESETVTALEYYLAHHYVAPFYNIKPSNEYDNYVNNHIDIYKFLLDHYKQRNESTRVNALLKQCFAPFHKFLPYLYNTAEMICFLYNANQGTLGDQLALVFAQNMLIQYQHKPSARTIDPQYGIQMITMVTNVQKLFNRKTDNIDKILKQFPKTIQ